MAFFGRGKNKIQDLEGIRDIYNYYVLKNSDIYIIDYNIYRDILRSYYKEVMSDILKLGYEFKLPFRFGSLHIIKRKINIQKLDRFGIDWVETIKNNKVIHHLNLHSKRFVYRFKWEKENTLIPNLYFYKFVATRANKRELAMIIKNKQCDYFE
jgi:hypothetical protein